MLIHSTGLSLKRCSFLIILLALLPSLPGTSSQAALSTQPALDVCRYALTSPHSPVGYPLTTLGFGSYLDWGAAGRPALPAGTEYVRVLRLGNGYPGQASPYQKTLTNLTTWLKAFPGATWVVGNEPDISRESQDNLLPEVYADRFFEVATKIRAQDPTAKIGFGTISQPTPIRLVYLNKVWARLLVKAGTREAASALIDVWSIHAFILNEAPYDWGTGLPTGYNQAEYGNPMIISMESTISIDLFKQRVQAFRTWMNQKGEREKPVWITEYGSLFPSIYVYFDNLTGKQVQITDQQAADFMSASFDYLLTASDPATGLTADNNRLVQRWFWYSLNEYRNVFGGSLFDPSNKQLTAVGQRFIDYTPPPSIPSDLSVSSVAVYPYYKNPNGIHADYLVKVLLQTALNANAPISTSLSLWDNETLVGSVPDTGLVNRCGGSRVVSFLLKDVLIGSDHVFKVQAVPFGRIDTNDQNHQATITVSNIAIAVPIITFGTSPTPTYLNNFNVSATTTNTDSTALTYSVSSGPCTLVSGTTFKPTGVGTCVVQASSVETLKFTPASNTQSITIEKAAPNITFGPVPSPTYLGSDFTVSAATSNTDSKVLTYDVSSGPCTFVSGRTFRSTGAGTCVVQATGPATANFLETSNTQSIPIAKAMPIITFGATIVEQDRFTVNATTTNSDSPALNYTVSSGPCTLVSDATFNYTGVVACVIQANGSETDNFKAASKTRMVVIGPMYYLPYISH